MTRTLPPGRDFGAASARLAAGGFLLVDSRFADGSRAPRHAHERAYFGFALEGGYVEEYRGRELEVTVATLAFDPGSIEHATRYGALHALRIEVDARLLAQMPLREPMLFRGGAPVVLARRLYAELRRTDAFSPLVVEGLGLELLAEAARAAVPAAPRWIERVRERVEEEEERTFSLAELAAGEGVHPMHLARAFRARFGCSVSEYVRARRIDFARERLLASDEPLVDIALAAGFASQSHFTTAFRRATGMTPAAFRRAKTFRA